MQLGWRGKERKLNEMGQTEKKIVKKKEMDANGDGEFVRMRESKTKMWRSEWRKRWKGRKFRQEEEVLELKLEMPTHCRSPAPTSNIHANPPPKPSLFLRICFFLFPPFFYFFLFVPIGLTTSTHTQIQRQAIGPHLRYWFQVICQHTLLIPF